MRIAAVARSVLYFVLFGTLGMIAAPLRADSGAPVQLRTYSSENGRFSLTVDPRWDRGWNTMRPLLTFVDGQGEALWAREPEDFEDFDFPLDAKVSKDGRYLVFGGVSVHNLSFDSEYREGLRIYQAATGRLIRFVSRRDLPPGSYGISTAMWYDADRTFVAGGKLYLFTPVRADPIVFELATGEVLEGRLEPGQGDDRDGWLARALGTEEGAEEPVLTYSPRRAELPTGEHETGTLWSVEPGELGSGERPILECYEGADYVAHLRCPSGDVPLHSYLGNVGDAAGHGDLVCIVFVTCPRQRWTVALHLDHYHDCLDDPGVPSRFERAEAPLVDRETPEPR